MGTSPPVRVATASDFDFLYGTWTVEHRKLASSVPAGCTEWLEFTSQAHAWPVLGGLGNVDTLTTENFPNIGHFEGMSLRLYDPATGLWRIWWASTTNPGVLDVPVVGRFDGPVGSFECDDTVAGTPVRVRYLWQVEDPDAPVWRQAFSFDAGASWHENWVMTFVRTGGTPT